MIGGGFGALQSILLRDGVRRYGFIDDAVAAVIVAFAVLHLEIVVEHGNLIAKGVFNSDDDI